MAPLKMTEVSRVKSVKGYYKRYAMLFHVLYLHSAVKLFSNSWIAIYIILYCYLEILCDSIALQLEKFYKFNSIAVMLSNKIKCIVFLYYVESAPLIEILPEEQKPPSLLHLSPVRCFNQFLDPFHTGETPPPLIDIGDVLEPEKPKELNLIEF